MSVTIKHKRSNTSSKVPQTTDLELGELAVNTYDGKVYIKRDNGSASVVEVGHTKLDIGALGLAGAATAIADANDAPLGSFTRFNGTETECVAAHLPSIGGTSTLRWWNITTFGVSNRTTQIASEVFGNGTARGRTFVRVKHDSTWYGWAEYHTTLSLPVSSFAKTFLDDTSAEAVRTTLGIEQNAAIGATEITVENDETTFEAIYNPDRVMVTQNGRVLPPSQYTATNGTEVTVPGAVNGDAIVVFSL